MNRHRLIVSIRLPARMANGSMATMKTDTMLRLRHDQFAGSQRVRENIANARAAGHAATSPKGLTALERAFYFRKLELEQSC